MTLEIISTIMNIFASLSVIATLGIVIYQIRQNTIATRMNAATMSTQLFIENLGRVVENADLAELLTRENKENFTAAEQLRLTNFFSASFRLYEMQFTHRKAGHYEEDLWEGTEQRLIRALQYDRMRDLWGENAQFYAPGFVAHVNRLVVDICMREDNPYTI